jgi:hypothetical protein
MNKNNLVSLSTSLFSLLLYFYPASFREEFGREMFLAFRDYCQLVLGRSGLPGLFQLWLTTFIDLLATAFVERLKELTQMSQSTFIRLCGAAGAVSGFYLLSSGLAAMKGNSFFNIPSSLIPLYAIALLLGVIGLYLFADTQTTGAKASVSIAFGGAAILALGLILTHWFNLDIGWNVWRSGELLHALGLLVFGLLARGIPSYWRIVPGFTGFFSLVLFILSAATGSLLFVSLFYIIQGLGWTVLGVMVATRVRSIPTGPHPTVGV